MAHIPYGIQMNQETNAGNNKQHDDRKPVDEKSKIQIKRSGMHRLKIIDLENQGRVTDHLEKQSCRNTKTSQNRKRGNPATYRLRNIFIADSVNDETKERQYRNEPH